MTSYATGDWILMSCIRALFAFTSFQKSFLFTRFVSFVKVCGWFLFGLFVCLPSTTWAKKGDVRKISLYGFARFDAIFNDARFDFAQFAFVVKPRLNGKRENELDLHPRLSRVGVRLWSGKLTRDIHLDGRVEIDFHNGGSESRAFLRLRHVYGVFHFKGLSLLFGQTGHLVAQLSPSANNDTTMWNAGNIGDRAPQLRLGYSFQLGRGKLSVQVASVMPNAVDKKDLDKNGTLDGQDAASPAVHARVGFVSPLWTKRPFRIAFGGVWAREEVSKPIAGKSEFSSLGVFAELDFPIHDLVGIRGEWFLGQNLSDLRGGIKQGVNPVRGTEIRTMGFWAEVWGKPLKWLTFVVGYSQDQPNIEDLEDGNASLNRVFWVSAMIRPVPAFKIALEYLRWYTAYKGDKMYDGNRVNLHFTYYFDWTSRF